MKLIVVWLLYDAHDLSMNQGFVSLMKTNGTPLGFDIQAVCTQDIACVLDQKGKAHCLRNGKEEVPDILLSRQRNFRYNAHFEAMGAMVCNGSDVARICNDKWQTYQFLSLPMPTTHYQDKHLPPVPTLSMPCVFKTTDGHGGDSVCEIGSTTALPIIDKSDGLWQERVANGGKDLRVYIVFEKIVTAVMRTAQDGLLSNFKQGGQITSHTLTQAEEDLVQQVIDTFHEAHAPLCFAGVDLLYREDEPIIGEVEDVVGCRMVYALGELNIVESFLQALHPAYKHFCIQKKYLS